MYLLVLVVLTVLTSTFYYFEVRTLKYTHDSTQGFNKLDNGMKFGICKVYRFFLPGDSCNSVR